MNKLSLSLDEVDYLLSPKAIRDQAATIFALTEGGETHFKFHPEKMKPTVDYILSVIRKNYPDLNIPFHSRWGHFRVGGIDRAQAIKHADKLELARIKLDLVITSVLLDAGAGAAWKLQEGEESFSRSEGLGVASFHMFMAGTMSGDRKSTRADSHGLKNVTVADLKKYFQVTESNPLVGVEGRVGLLNSLSKALENKNIFKDGRPGNILDYLIQKYGKTIPAEGVLRAVLDGLGPIWPGRLSAQGINLGDIWKHSKADLVPFHKLSQWMTYSLIEPIVDAGVQVNGVENLTGLAEYRNGGLLIDSGLFSLRDPSHLNKKWKPDTDLVIEWRALTIHMLDLFGNEVQKAFGKSPQEFPLAKVLEGGTWWAGRFLAKEKRENGDPPIQIDSDGTVF